MQAESTCPLDDWVTLTVAGTRISGRRKAGGRGAVATLLIGVFFTCLRGILVIA